MYNQVTLIIGANSAIAKALAKEVCHQAQLVVISRDVSFYQQDCFNLAVNIAVPDYSEPSIIEAISLLTEAIDGWVITRVFVCHGVLHNERCSPEKSLDRFSPDSFSEILHSNAITPLLWLKHLTPLLKSKVSCKLTFFSARVGSIGDNHLGGWYSYRASKAALNMLLKSASIELARRSTNVKLISFHPGTTDSPLSKPFSKNVSAEKLFTPQFVAQRLIDIVEDCEVDGHLSYVDWQGQDIPW